MCHAVILNQLEETVREFVEQEVPFTAYDVTITTREREHIELLHRKVRDDIHQLPDLADALQYGDYVQSNLRAPNGQPVILYHPSGYDVANYKFRDGSTAIPARPANTPLGHMQQAAIATAVAMTQQVPQPVDDGKFSLDYRNRLMVPTRFLRDLGVNPYDHVYVIADAVKNQVRIYTAQTPPITGIMQMVERNGDVRIANKTLSGAGINSTKFNIETKDLGNSRIIEITKA